MNEELFKLLLNGLTPQVLAYLARDLEETLADWRYYPEDAPPAAIQKELGDALATIRSIGAARAAAEGLDFARLLEQALAEQQEDEWTAQRNRQVQQNWLNDLK